MAPSVAQDGLWRCKRGLGGFGPAVTAPWHGLRSAALHFAATKGVITMITLCGSPISNYYNKVKLALLERACPLPKSW